MTPTAWSYFAVIGPEHAGKSTLTRYLGQRYAPRATQAMYLAPFPSVPMPTTRERLIPTVLAAPSRCYFVYDVAGGSASLSKRFLSEFPVVVLVVDVFAPQLSELRAIARMLRRASGTSVLVFLNKVELEEDDEVRELLELELRTILSDEGVRGDEVSIFQGCALEGYLARSKDTASLDAVMETIERIPLDPLPLETRGGGTFPMKKTLLPAVPKRPFEVVRSLFPHSERFEFACGSCANTLSPPLVFEGSNTASAPGIESFQLVENPLFFRTNWSALPGARMQSPVSPVLECTVCTKEIGTVAAPQTGGLPMLRAGQVLYRLLLR